jgi:hypothetical protein
MAYLWFKSFHILRLVACSQVYFIYNRVSSSITLKQKSARADKKCLKADKAASRSCLQIDYDASNDIYIVMQSALFY